MQPEPLTAFNQEGASSYDKRWAKLTPTRDALHLLIHALLFDLPADAHILCVGAGTGAELLYLAQAFPQWHFTAVDPSAPMLEICRQRAQDLGVASHCTFHMGYLDSLPASAPFDAATCLLVAHFLQKEERHNLFQQIATRLSPEGYLVSSELSGDQSTSEYQSLVEVWKRMLRFADVSEEDIGKNIIAWKRDIAILPLKETEALIASSGFDTPVLFFQSLLIRAWYSRKITP